MKIKYMTYSISKKNNLILRWADGQNVISTSLTDSMIKLHVYCILVKQRNSKRVTQQQNHNYHVWEKLLGPHFFARSGTQTNVFVRFDLWFYTCSYMSLWPLRLGNPLKQLSKCVPKDVSRWQPRVETSKKDSNAIMNRALRKKVYYFLHAHQLACFFWQFY